MQLNSYYLLEANRHREGPCALSFVVLVAVISDVDSLACVSERAQKMCAIKPLETAHAYP